MEITVDLLNQKMEEVIASREKLWSKKFFDTTRQVSKSFGLVEKAAVVLADAAKRAWGSITRPTEQHAIRLSKQVTQLCNSVAATTDISYDAVKAFEDRSRQATKSIARAYNKYAGSVIRPLKSETSKLEAVIVSLNRSVAALSEVLENSRLEEMRAAAHDTDELVRQAYRLHALIEEKAEAEKALQELQNRELAFGKGLSELSKQEKIVELSHIEEQIEQKETEVLLLLEPLSKPLRKIDRPELQLDAGPAKNILSRMTQDPLEALLGPPITELREALGLLHRTIEQEGLLLDQRTRRKSLEAINVLQAGALEKFREHHSVLQANRQEILRQLRSSGAYHQWVGLRSQIEIIQSEAGKCLERIADLHMQQHRQRSLVLEQKTKLEKTLENVLEERVSVSVPF